MTDVPDGSVVITAEKMYDEQQKMRIAVERLISTVDPALADLRSDVATLYSARNAVAQRVEDVATRTTVIETKLNAAWAVIGLVIVAMGTIAALWVR